MLVMLYAGDIVGYDRRRLELSSAPHMITMAHNSVNISTYPRVACPPLSIQSVYAARTSSGHIPHRNI